MAGLTGLGSCVGSEARLWAGKRDSAAAGMSGDTAIVAGAADAAIVAGAAEVAVAAGAAIVSGKATADNAAGARAAHLGLGRSMRRGDGDRCSRRVPR